MYNERLLKVKYKHILIGCPTAVSNGWKLKRLLGNDATSERKHAKDKNMTLPLKSFKKKGKKRHIHADRAKSGISFENIINEKIIILLMRSS